MSRLVRHALVGLALVAAGCGGGSTAPPGDSGIDAGDLLHGDVTVDLPAEAPDAPPDLPPADGVDRGPDAPADVPADTTPDLPIDRPVDVAPDSGPDAGCLSAADCDDGDACNGAEICDTVSGTCVAGRPAADGTACTLAAGGAGACRSGLCVASTCGDGRVDTGEECDDGNPTDGDGCDLDCTWSCSGDGDCRDREPCNGSETCNSTAHTCVAGRPIPDGTACVRDTGALGVCRSGACADPVCGNAALEPGEDCDDGNADETDGCRSDCTFTCVDAAGCSDGLTCNGAESCNVTAHTCSAGTAAADGTACDADGDAATRDLCFGGACRPGRCGDGFVDPGATPAEQCDDGNGAEGDGCDGDCTWSCTTAAECADAEVCNGAETCNATTHVCAPGTLPAPGTACTLASGGAGSCRDGACVSAACGNSIVETGEQCDDGNAEDADGCRRDCTWTCEDAAACSDGLTCNGAETCNTTTHRCVAGTAPADGAACDADGSSATRDICLGGACTASRCGDTFVDSGATPAEQCDDGNAANGDGCDTDCTFTCTTAADCSDGNACNGAEICDGATHLCGAGTALADGAACDADANPATRDVCRSGRCTRSSCGDGYVDAGATPAEQCDDGNAASGDGCDSDCTWTCTTASECSDGNICDGTETCDPTTHTCAEGTPRPDGTRCLVGREYGTCVRGRCLLSSCGNRRVDRGEECDDGNAVDDDGCTSTCEFSCHAAADCNDRNSCTADTCDRGGTGQVCNHRSAADGTACTPLLFSRCYENYRCSSGTCRGTAVDCDDGDPCSEDTCNMLTGCQHRDLGRQVYRDVDGDGYGNPSVFICGLIIPPGYVPRAGDCCDSNADVNPAETAFHTTSYTCGLSRPSFDYNCDGTAERQYTAAGSCSRACTTTPGWTGTVPSCGTSGSYLSLCLELRPPLSGCLPRSLARTQGCR